MPQCDGKACGPDGCEGQCGECGSDLACTSAGTCVGAPPGPAARRFDVATLQCAAKYPSCTHGAVSYDDCCPALVDGDPKNKCLCRPELDGLNYGKAHFVGVASDKHRGDLWAAGNFQAAYVNELNDLYPSETGGAKADQTMAAAEVGFPSGVPEWFIVNELSTGLWPDSAAYRQYVKAFAAKLSGTYGKSVMIASPFPAPAANAADWAALAADAFIVVEVQLTGAEVNANGNSVAWCKQQYQASVDAYSAVGVPLTRLMLVDNFANSEAGAGWGREGVSKQGWLNAIQVRAEAASQLGFAGYWSYAWGNNAMGDDEVTRLELEAAYAAQTLP